MLGGSIFGCCLLFFLGLGPASGQLTRLTASDGAENSYFGFSVAIEGAVSLIGAYGESVIYAFDCPTAASCSQVAKIQPSGVIASDQFGFSLAISGSTVVAGAPKYSGTGVAYIFSCASASTCSTPVMISTTNVTSGDEFGYAVAISGNLVVISAPYQSDGTGAAYIFSCPTPSSCSLVTIIYSSDPSPEDFGVAIGISSSLVIVGAYLLNNYQGAAYSFNCTTSGCSTAYKLSYSDSTEGDAFGGAIAISGAMAIVGASGKNHSQGAVYVFDCTNPPACSSTLKILPSNAANYNQFGSAIAISGSSVAIGSSNSNDGIGVVYLYNCASPSSCSLNSEQSSATGSSFGSAVAISDNVAIFGSPNENTYTGAAYSYYTGPAIPTATPTPTPTPTMTPSAGNHLSVFSGLINLAILFAIWNFAS